MKHLLGSSLVRYFDRGATTLPDTIKTSVRASNEAVGAFQCL